MAIRGKKKKTKGRNGKAILGTRAQEGEKLNRKKLNTEVLTGTTSEMAKRRIRVDPRTFVSELVRTK